MFLNTVNGIVNAPFGYSPNTRPNTNQTILRDKLAIPATLSIGDSSIQPGYFLSKSNVLVNDTTWGLPTNAALLVGNLWIATEGLVPDTLGNDTIQGNVNGAPPVFISGQMCNVVPFPEMGTVILAAVSLTEGDVMAVNQPLFVKADGTLTIDLADAINPNLSVGYILETDQTTIADTGVYQMQVVLMPTYMQGTVPYVTDFAPTYGGGAATQTVTVAGMLATDKVFPSLLASTNAVAIQKTTVSDGQFVVTYSADPGAGTILAYSATH